MNNLQTDDGHVAGMRHMTVKELPEAERPDDKCIKYGPQSLSDAELLAAVIRTGNGCERAVELAYRILSLSPSHKGAVSLYYLSIDQLKEIKGIGDVKAVQLVCIAELSRRMSRAVSRERFRIVDSEALASYFMEDMRHLPCEQTRLVLLDLKNCMIDQKVVFTGHQSGSFLEPRELLAEALKSGAAGIAVLHNHPSGDPAPSVMDVSATGRIRDACNVVGIRFFDHVIIGDLTYFSFRDAGIIK